MDLYVQVCNMSEDWCWGCLQQWRGIAKCKLSGVAITGFPNMLRCVDRTCAHTQCRLPTLYHDQHSYASLNMHVIYAVQGFITASLAMFPYCVHNSQVFEDSRFHQ